MVRPLVCVSQGLTGSALDRVEELCSSLGRGSTVLLWILMVHRHNWVGIMSQLQSLAISKGDFSEMCDCCVAGGWPRHPVHASCPSLKMAGAQSQPWQRDGALPLPSVSLWKGSCQPRSDFWWQEERKCHPWLLAEEPGMARWAGPAAPGMGPQEQAGGGQLGAGCPSPAGPGRAEVAAAGNVSTVRFREKWKRRGAAWLLPQHPGEGGIRQQAVWKKLRPNPLSFDPLCSAPAKCDPSPSPTLFFFPTSSLWNEPARAYPAHKENEVGLLETISTNSKRCQQMRSCKLFIRVCLDKRIMPYSGQPTFSCCYDHVFHIAFQIFSKYYKCFFGFLVMLITS